MCWCESMNPGITTASCPSSTFRRGTGGGSSSGRPSQETRAPSTTIAVGPDEGGSPPNMVPAVIRVLATTPPRSRPTDSHPERRILA